MKIYLATLMVFYSAFCFGQKEQMGNNKINPFPAKGISYLGLINLTNEYSPKNLFINADSETKLMSDISFPNNPYSKFVYLEDASKINLKSDIKQDSLRYFKYSVVEDDSLMLVSNQSPIFEYGSGVSPSFLTANFGTYNISGKKLKISIYKLGDKKNIKEITIYSKKIELPKIVQAQFVTIRPPIIKTIDATETSGGTKATSTIKTTIDNSEYINMDVRGAAIDAGKKFNYVDLSIERVENLFLYHIIIKHTYEGKTSNTYLNNIDWTSNVYGTYRTFLDIKNFSNPGKYELIICPKIQNIDKYDNASSIKFELKSEAGFLKKKV